MHFLKSYLFYFHQNSRFFPWFLVFSLLSPSFFDAFCIFSAAFGQAEGALDRAVCAADARAEWPKAVARERGGGVGGWGVEVCGKVFFFFFFFLNFS